MDAPIQAFEHFLTQAVSVARGLRRVIGGTVAFDAKDIASGFFGMDDANVDPISCKRRTVLRDMSEGARVQLALRDPGFRQAALRGGAGLSGVSDEVRGRALNAPAEAAALATAEEAHHLHDAAIEYLTREILETPVVVEPSGAVREIFHSARTGKVSGQGSAASAPKRNDYRGKASGCDRRGCVSDPPVNLGVRKPRTTFLRRALPPCRSRAHEFGGPIDCGQRRGGEGGVTVKRPRGVSDRIKPSSLRSLCASLTFHRAATVLPLIGPAYGVTSEFKRNFI